ncbi:uncharacterized protein LOC106706090 [Latimeria chalumnae]|uniref:uncharacterized protein LOC106706090 n=1 Tax=Latimeria chalumnae TaxID=7897 RepID=UPI0006D92EDF|nr:PREDICTED: uncharacterized protein LOC106706090 [Latimeria chalumnae]|eukprot:XP_014351962.1 PREDICTED: uncharacterized protein LOC106706090 [Latimeria chalumnae]
MASERFQNRRKNCIFRLAVQHCPFRKLGRRMRNNTTYEVGLDPSLAGRWPSFDTVSGTFSQISPQYGVESTEFYQDHTEQLSLDAIHCPSPQLGGVPMCLGDCRNCGQVLNAGPPPPLLPPLEIVEMIHEDPIDTDYEPLESQASNAQPSLHASPQNVAPVFGIQEVHQHPQPSVASMEIDGEVDPETGERTSG